jgi:hypothetical protein
MRLVRLLLVAAVLVYGLAQLPGISSPQDSSPSTDADRILRDAYASGRSDFQVQGAGIVAKLLSDDVKGSRHQRFLLRLGTGQTVLVAHNVDLAPRLSGIRTGDSVEFYGEYAWNQKGGVIHWTHRDPGNRHTAGWLKRDGRVYQ